MLSPPDHALRQLPKVDRVLSWPELAPLLGTHRRPDVVRAIRESLELCREQLLTGVISVIPERERLAAMTVERLAGYSAMGLRPVINGTGVVIHTNLGRSPLADEAVEAVAGICRGYSNLEYDLASGTRGKRSSRLDALLAELTGAESSLVVNNNAAAVLLALSTLAAGRDVIVSRGELVEIGGSFRIPDVLRHSGARLVEVGSTNRTHFADYRAALSENTALLLKVHTSNFAMVGFTAQASLSELSGLGRETGIPVLLDAGSGCLVDLEPHGIRGEMTIGEALRQGADVVTFSGDKLLGGPQAGIIVGRGDLLEPMAHHPLLRAVRADKMALAALEATLHLHRDPRDTVNRVPVLRMLTLPPEEVLRWARLIIRRLKRRLPEDVRLLICHGDSCAGGGALPLYHPVTARIEVRMGGASPVEVEDALRRCAAPVAGRVHQGRYLLDARTLGEQDIPKLGASLVEAATLLRRIGS